MENQAQSVFLSLIPIIILMVPLIFLNIAAAKRKGKDPILFGILSFIPFVNMFSFFYLISLTDKSVIEKLDMIIANLKK